MKNSTEKSKVILNKIKSLRKKQSALRQTMLVQVIQFIAYFIILTYIIMEVYQKLSLIIEITAYIV